MEDKKPYEVTVVETTPATLLNMAIAQGADLDRLEKLMALQDKWEQNQARKAYTVAMSEFKKNPPDIEKDKHVKYGNTEYNHASLGNVTEKINAALSEHGLSAAWETSQGEKGGVTVICRITHVLGHSESTSLTAGSDTSGAKNAIQALGSTISYLQRYSLLCLTGLATHDQDNDGNQPPCIDEKQKNTIVDYINEKGVDVAKFLIFMGADSIDTIKADEFKKATDALKLARGKTKSE